MNIIKQQREEVIRENNTGQEYINTLLNSLSHRSEVLHIKDSLHGDLDFSLLFNNGFKFLHTIILQEGEITSIRNIPKTVHTLICPKNFLVSLDDLPDSLIHLEVPYNYITAYNFTITPKLKIFHMEYNHLENLEHFSNELTEIYIQNNKLTHLDLKGLPNLKTLNISNNKITIVENLPENIVDFMMDNTPSIEFRNSLVIPIIETDKSNDESIQQNINYVEALRQYYKLKNNYDTELHKNRKTAFEKFENKKEGKRKALEVKAKCIKCKRPVGSIFTRNNEKCSVICGDSNQPCNLNIELFHGSYMSLDYVLYMFKHDIEDIKDDIITQKLDTLFNYVSEDKSINLFKKTIELYNNDNKLFIEVLNKYNENHFNENKLELIQKKKDHIFRLIEQIQLLIKEYEETGNREVLKTAVELQVNTLFPETRNLRLLESEIMEIKKKIHFNGKVEHFLLKNDVVLSKEDFTFGEEARVIKFHGV